MRKPALHWILDHPKVAGFVAFMSLAAAFSPKVSAVATWLCIVIGALFAYAMLKGLAERHKWKTKTFGGACATSALVIFGFGCWLTQEKSEDMGKKMEQILLGQEYGPEKLASQFPIGYVVFQLKNNDKLEFYKGLSMVQNYDFDWSKVKY